MPQVSLLATLVATIAGFVLGALWYGPLLGARWMAAIGVTRDTMARGVSPARAYGITFVLGFIAAYVVGLYLGPNPGLSFSVMVGLAIGVCFVAFSLATNELFERRPISLILINGGYHAVRFTITGLAFGLLG